MQPHHFSSQTHDLESCPLREENRQLKKKLEDANAYAQTLEWARDKLQQENKDLSYHINYVLKKRISELEAMVPKWNSLDSSQPEEGKRVLVCEKRYVGISELICEDGSCWFDDYEDATHWMPLPPPANNRKG